ncbi:Yip1 family protein [Streptomyces amakusaensis]|uniref:Yip1 family protein n=1 Tax=Streptomyces amakusaensis TaxID=67271 RepID=A0ABW0AUK6_9ACTN
MAGFRIGRGRDNRTQQQQPRQAPPPHGGGGRAAPPHTQQQPPPWPQPPGGGHRGGPQRDEPEYFGDPYQQQQPPRQPPYPGQAPAHDPYATAPGPAPYANGPRHDPYANNPGHTQAFRVDDPYGQGATYQAGDAPAPPAGPRLPWKQLLSGMVLRPAVTFGQMRDYAVWGPALAITFVYGMLAIFGFDKAREETINATISSAIPYVLTTGVAFVIGGLILGAVTHTLARQLSGTGAWQPTVGFSMLLMSITDAPRLLFAMFLGGENALVQVVGWMTWLAAGALFTVMVGKSHDLPWPKALGASAIQLIALLSIIKLGTI